MRNKAGFEYFQHSVEGAVRSIGTKEGRFAAYRKSTKGRFATFRKSTKGESVSSHNAIKFAAYASAGRYNYGVVVAT